jgi:hypothetical protein
MDALFGGLYNKEFKFHEFKSQSLHEKHATANLRLENKYSSYLRVSTFRLNKAQPAIMLRKIITVYFQNHTKHVYILCGQNAVFWC